MMNDFRTMNRRMMAFVFLILFSVTQLQAQEPELKTEGMNNAELFDNLFRGHFEDISLTPQNMQFVGVLNQYIRNYGRQCPEYLPADKVMIMDTECATEEVTTNGYGVEVSRYCVEWVQVPSGIYAKPEMYGALLQLEQSLSGESLKMFMEMIGDQNAIGNSVDMAHKAKALLYDMSALFQQNACDSPGMKRFEENLRLFALGKPAIRMAGQSKYTAMKEAGGPTGPQDFARLIDDLVVDQAKTWMFNKYISGSVSGVRVLSSDDQGRPGMIQANYRYSGFGGSSNGWVKVRFNQGLPDGIYFFDFPSNRKTPTPSIVASYANGDYSN